MVFELTLQQESLAGMPDGWACGTINSQMKDVVGCKRAFGKRMYLVQSKDPEIVSLRGAQWICDDCVRQLGLVW